MSDWERVALGELAEIFDGPHATPTKTSDGPLFLGISNLVNGRLDLTTPEYLSEADFVRWTRRVTPQPGDVLFSYETRLGEAALVPANLRCCLGRRMGLLRSRVGKVDNRFLLYAYLGPRFQETLRSRTVHGSTVDRIPLNEMGTFPIDVPSDIEEQRAIAHILGSLDDKIDLNQQLADTLETTGRAIFKSWFVDFDLVYASTEGRVTEQRNRLLDLFVASIDQSETAGVPATWTRAPLEHWVDALSGGTPSKKNKVLWNGDIPWISPKSMTSIHADEAEDFVTPNAIGNGTRLAPAHCTLVMVRGMGLHTKVRVSQARSPVTFNQDVKALVPRGIEPSLLLFALLNAQDELLGRVESSGHGTGRLPSDILLSYEITMPPIERQADFARVFDAINDRIAVARQESRTLGSIRSTLLPRLISGELRVRDAERIVGNAT